jgi:hypothetical protein
VKKEGKKDQSLNDALVEDADETDKDITTTPTNQPPTPPSILEDSDKSKIWIKSLSYVNWALTFAFICLQLPYALLVAFVGFVLIGTITYLRGETQTTNYTIPISKFARMVVQNIGSAQRGGGASFSGSRILSPRRQSMIEERGTPTSGSPAGDGDSADSPRGYPSAESTLVGEKHQLKRSWSEGSGHSITATAKRPSNFGQS